LLFILFTCYIRFAMPGASHVAEQVNWLFLDMNSYFASVEQQVQPHLRGRPTAVVTVDADSTVCIAASYEAKAFGVSTGTALGEARKKCPDLNVVVARHEIYVEYHEKIKAAVEQNCLHISKIVSIDEMECRLGGRDRQISNAQELARKVKQSDLFRWGNAALFRWAGAEPFSGQGGFQHEETGWSDNAYHGPTSADFVLIKTARSARNWPQHGTAPAQTRHCNHGTTLAA
jgi:hypothetical protein